MPIEIAIGVLVLLVLLVVYRNPITMLLPLVAIGAALVTAQAAVAGVSDLFGMGVSNQSIIILSAMIAGAGTDYAVFLDQPLSRLSAARGGFQRRGEAGVDLDRKGDHRIRRHGGSHLPRAQLRQDGGVLHDRGGVRDRGRGGIPGRDYVAARHSGAGRAARLGQTAARTHRSVLAPLGGSHRPAAEGPSGWQSACAGHSRQLRGLGALQLRRSQSAGARSAPSSIGYAALERHFPISQAVPEYILVQSPRDLRTPQALADLEQMASGSANCRTSASSAA